MVSPPSSLLRPRVLLPLLSSFVLLSPSSAACTSVKLRLQDSFGDGWNNAYLSFTSKATGEVLYEGITLEEDPADSNTGSESEQMLCFEGCGCYDAQMIPGEYINEVSWSLSSLEDEVIVTYSGSDPDADGQGDFCLSSECKECPPGSGLAEPALTTCQVCPAGKYGDPSEPGPCQGCGVGYYNQYPGASSFDSSCVQCPDGSTTVDDASTACQIKCFTLSMYDSSGDGWAGAYLSFDNTDTDRMLFDWLTLDYGYSYEQQLCFGMCGCILGKSTAGSLPVENSWKLWTSSGDIVAHVSGEGSDSFCFTDDCPVCDPGSGLRDPYFTVCDPCKAGSYQADAGPNACVQCPVGYYGTLPESTSASDCRACPAGKYQSAMGAAGAGSCVECDVGTYAEDTGTELCTMCGMDRYNPDTGSTSADACQDCPEGTTTSSDAAGSCYNEAGIKATLRAFYRALGGVNWVPGENSVYKDTPVQGWIEDTEVPVCSSAFTGSVKQGWTGIECDWFGTVTKINLKDMNLRGSIPESFYESPEMTSLRSVDLSDNFISGGMSDNIGLLSTLAELALGNNTFVGPVSDSIQGMSYLKELDLSFNRFTGRLDFLCTLPSLQKIKLRNNLFEGSIPTCEMTNLVILGLSYNKLE